jgi:chromosome segregation ATPase
LLIGSSCTIDGWRKHNAYSPSCRSSTLPSPCTSQRGPLEEECSGSIHSSLCLESNSELLSSEVGAERSSWQERQSEVTKLEAGSDVKLRRNEKEKSEGANATMECEALRRSLHTQETIKFRALSVVEEQRAQISKLQTENKTLRQKVLRLQNGIREQKDVMEKQHKDEILNREKDASLRDLEEKLKEKDKICASQLSLFNEQKRLLNDEIIRCNQVNFELTGSKNKLEQELKRKKVELTDKNNQLKVLNDQLGKLKSQLDAGYRAQITLQKVKQVLAEDEANEVSTCPADYIR